MENKNIAKHIVHYRNVFIYLLIGTVLTVGASYLDFSVQNSIAGAMFVGLAGISPFQNLKIVLEKLKRN